MLLFWRPQRLNHAGPAARPDQNQKWPAKLNQDIYADLNITIKDFANDN